MGKVIDFTELNRTRIKHKNKKVAFCTGCFDILQAGHAIFFEQCKKFAEVLVVGVGRDENISYLKGPNRPINNQNNRLYLVAELQNVDYATLNEEKMLPGKIDFLNTLKELKPDLFILNEDDSGLREKKELCKKLKIELKLVPRTVPDFLKKTSSTEITNKLKTQPF
jgi:cytidyltransferase-like protein